MRQECEAMRYVFGTYTLDMQRDELRAVAEVVRLDQQVFAVLAYLNLHAEQLQAHEVMVFADELDIPLLPKVGAAWLPQGSQEEVMTPGKHEKYSLAGTLTLATGQLLHCLGPRKTHALLRALLTLLDRTYPERWGGVSLWCR
jgi:hypothetical protein